MRGRRSVRPVGPLTATRVGASGCSEVLKSVDPCRGASGQRPVVGPASDEGSVEVGPEVFDVLAGGAESQQRGRQVFLAGESGAAFDGRFDRAETGSVPDGSVGAPRWRRRDRG